MSLVVVKVNEQHNCRAVIATNFTHTFCGSALVKSLGLKIQMAELRNPPKVLTSDGTPIEFIGQVAVQLELGPWRSAGPVPVLVCFDCPTDVLIGQDLVDAIGKRHPVKFEYYKNTVNIGGTRVSMLDPLPAEERFMTMQVLDPRTNEAINMDAWRGGARWGMKVMDTGGGGKRDQQPKNRIAPVRKK